MTNPYEPPTDTGAMQPGFDEVAEKQIKDAAQKALIVAIVSFFCCAPAAIWAIMKGREIQRSIDATGVGVSARGTAKAAVIVGIVTLVFATLGLIVRLSDL